MIILRLNIKKLTVDFKEIVMRRRSHRKFLADEVPSSDVRLLLRAALMSPTSKNRRSWQFVVIDDKATLHRLSESKDAGAQFVKDAPLAIVVAGEREENDCWVEDCSIAAVSMQYQAEELGLGTCWVQLRGRQLADGTPTEDVVRSILGLPGNVGVLCVVAVGYPADERKPQNEERLKWDRVHHNKWSPVNEETKG
ncbi:MAG: nitroreductase family protein [Prevotella sp.]|nr:nitroreductase family protein [Prevotella sp.]